MDSENFPQRPKLDQKPRSSPWSIIMAGVTGLIVFAGLTLLAAPLVGVALGVAMIVGGICVVAFLHYIVWGYWLGDSIRREVEEEERQQAGGNGGPNN
jgi:FtsH-binding integral membrane protein